MIHQRQIEAKFYGENSKVFSRRSFFARLVQSTPLLLSRVSSVSLFLFFSLFFACYLRALYLSTFLPAFRKLVRNFRATRISKTAAANRRRSHEISSKTTISICALRHTIAANIPMYSLSLFLFLSAFSLAAICRPELAYV